MLEFYSRTVGMQLRFHGASGPVELGRRYKHYSTRQEIWTHRIKPCTHPVMWATDGIEDSGAMKGSTQGSIYIRILLLLKSLLRIQVLVLWVCRKHSR